MAYRYFDDFREAQKQGFMSPANLAAELLAASSVFVELGPEQKEQALQKWSRLFKHACYALQLEMLNAPSDIENVVLGGVQIPVSVWAFVRGTGNQAPLFTMAALEPIGFLATKLRKWQGTEKNGWALSANHWIRLHRLAVQAFLREENLPTGQIPAEYFFIASKGQLVTTLSLQSAQELDERIEYIQHMKFKSFKGAATKENGEALPSIRNVFHARKRKDRKLQPIVGIRLPAHSLQYMHRGQGNYALCYATEISKQVRLIRNAAVAKDTKEANERQATRPKRTAATLPAATPVRG